MAETLPLLAGYSSASIQGLVASGPPADHPVRRLRSAAVVDVANPRCARLDGFSLHANVAVPAHTRARLEHLCRYLLNPPLALELLEKLAVLVQAPPNPLTPVSRGARSWRPLIILRSQEGVGHEASALGACVPALLLHGLSPPADAQGRRSWAALLERVFAFDVVHCPRCGGRRRIVAVHTRPRLARCHLDLGKRARRTGQRQQAQEHLTTATTLLREMGMRLRVEQAEAELRY